MLAIRLQRTGRTGHAQFRLIAQDRRFSPLSGRVVAYLGSYDPHTKAVQLDSEKVAYYLEKGAQPSPRAVKLLKAEGIKLPKWVAVTPVKKKSTRNPDKLRKNRPVELKVPKPEITTEAPTDAPAEEPVAEEKTEDKPVEEVKAETAEEKPAEESKAEAEAAEKPVETAAEEAKPEAEQVKPTES